MNNLILHASQYFHVLYQWGGNMNYSERLDCMVSDCSGYVLRALSDIGILLPDMTTKQLGAYWRVKGMVSNAEMADLLLFGPEIGKEEHIALGYSNGLMLECGGAGKDSLGMSKEQLILRHAGVRIKKISNRKDFLYGIIINLR